MTQLLFLLKPDLHYLHHASCFHAKKKSVCFIHVFVVFGPKRPGQAIQKDLSSEAIIAWEGKMRAAGLMLPVQDLISVFVGRNVWPKQVPEKRMLQHLT